MNIRPRKVLNSLPAPGVGLENQRPVDFALLVRQYGSKPETTWDRSWRGFYDPPIFDQLRAFACAMQISLTHPAVIIGVIDRPDSPSVSSTGNVDPAIQHLALQAEPSITAILRIWELRQKQRGASPEPPSWMIVFGLLITVDGAVTIVAHYPNSDGIT